MSVRLAVDIGGTFTDVVLERDGVTSALKVPSTPARPADAFIAGVEALLATTGTRAEAVSLIVHGSTLATNALIERRGVKTALLTSAGHRDSLEMAYENRFDQYTIDADRLPPLVPRALRLPITERLDRDGHVRTPLDERSVRAAIEVLGEQQVQSVAVGFLHSYANPAHEERVGVLLAEALPDVAVSLSSRVCPEIREYERQSTTVANAYVQPLMAGYLADLATRLRALGLAAPCLLMTSGGSLVTIDTAAHFPVRLIESGPAGGAILAAHLARRLGEPRVLSFDMGGTTAKICLIDDAEPLLERSFEIDRAHRFMKGSGMPVRIPVLEMVEIGAGGGSMAAVDELRRISVGPLSAGAEPGPACYGAGGERATVTDANLLLGRLDPEHFAGGRLRLDRAAATRALHADVGAALGLDAEAAALGVVEIVDENMAGAARVHAVERARQVRGRTLIAFGGAAPLHAARLAGKLGIERIIVPHNAGVGSAIGFLLAPVAYEVVRSRYQRLDDYDGALIGELFEDMLREATEVVRLGAPAATLRVRRHAFARYAGQGHEVKIELPCEPDADHAGTAIRAAFEHEYRRQYGRCVPGLAVEVLTWATSVAEQRAAPAEAGTCETTDAVPAASARREIRFPGCDGVPSAALHERETLAAGATVAGPAAILEAQTTSIVPPGFRAHHDADGNLVIERAADEAAQAPASAATVRDQVLWDRLIALVEEQAQAILRTAFSTTVREAGDLSAGVFDLDGRMLAQAVTGTPGHVNAMATSVGCFLGRFAVEQMREGDVYVTNDPWHGTGHLFDFTVLTPAFRGGRPIALFASTVHVVDIGGRGFGPDAGEVYEEGVCIPMLPLFRAGEAEQSVFEIIRANVREPVQVVGDLYSLAGSNEVGARRLVELADEFGLDTLDGIAEHIVQTSRQAMLAAIRALPRGRYEHAMTVDGYERPVTLRAALTVADDGIEVDFDGTSPMSPFGINVPMSYTAAYAAFGVRCIVGSIIPNNAGTLDTIRVRAPAGCILNAPRPAAVAVRHVIGQMLPDVMFGCLEQALPGRVPAEGSSSLWNPMLAGGHGIVGEHDYATATPFSVTIFHSGGTGARPGKDGLSATAFPSGVRNTPVEITESVAPLLFRRKEYRPGSGGAGRYRGGDGQVIEIEHAQGAPFAVFALFDRIEHPARGRAGGGDGAPGRVSLASGRTLRGKGKQIVPAGDRLLLELPGGGGLGASPPMRQTGES